MVHTPRHKSSQSHPCWVAEALPLRRCVFLKSSKIFWLRNPGKFYLIWPVTQAVDSWTLRGVGRLLSSGVDSVKEGESLLFMSLGSHYQYHTINWAFLDQQDAFSQSVRKCSATKDVKQECWIVGLKEGTSLEKAWTEEGAEFYRSDLIGFSQMTSNWANGH